MNKQVTAQNQIATRQRVRQNIEGQEIYPVGCVEQAISLHKAGDNIHADLVKRVPVNFLRPIKIAAGNVEDDLNV